MESRILGDYKLIKQIGQGSLGTVYLAEHRFMKKQYVLKVLPEELASDRTFIQRFEEDVGILVALEHPNIVKIHNISFAQGQYFLVMDCIVDELGETTNLGQFMLARSKRIEEGELIRLLTQIADALDYAHSKKGGGKGIIHRGIKLNNILVGKGKNGIDLYLSDFGLSRIIGTGAVLSRTYKAVADALGIGTMIMAPKNGPEKYPNPSIDAQKLTPLHISFLQNYAFLAPEQARLDYPQPSDAKVDIYAFGVLAYYLLMGEFPYGIFEMPSERIVEYEGDWDALIAACLQSNPAKRPELLLPVLEKIMQKHEPSTYQQVHIQHIEAACEEAKLQPQPMMRHELADEYAANTSYTEEQLEPVNAQAQITFAFAADQPITQKVIAKPNAQTSSLKPIIHVTQLERPQSDPDPASVFQIDTSVKQYTPERKETKHIQPLLTDMVVIPGGIFYRGSNDGNRDETPRHQVTLSSFAIDIHPVTNEQFVRFLEVMGGER